MYTYIKNDTAEKYISFSEPLSPELFNNLGKSYKDYVKGKWVLLSEAQVKFHQDNPSAKVHEVWEMRLDPTPIRTLEDAKFEMLDQIEIYDLSSNVNGFTINNTIEAWFTPLERSNYKSSIDAAKLLGLDTLSFYVGDTLLEISPLIAESLLALILLYADKCFIVTKQHKTAIEALTSIEEIDNYDYTAGYPDKMNFNL